MYKINIPNDGRDVTYASTLAPMIQTIINDYLNNGRYCTVKLKSGENIEVGVGNKSTTRKFLTQLLDINRLQTFLLYNPIQQVNLINTMHSWKYPDDLIFRKLTKGILKKYYKGANGRIDNFNEIMYDIFVVNGYENKNGESGFDKRSFIVNSNLRVCPYCSEEVIEPTDNTKKQIDHFLPKRKYPFFALSYYNLIPSCDTCNEVGNKGTNDPVLSNLGIQHAIINPYLFNPDWIRYHLRVLNAAPFNNSDFDLIIGFKKRLQQIGYNEFFDISDRQSRHRNIAAADYRRLMKYAAEHFYEGMMMDGAWLHDAFEHTLAIDPAENVPEKEVHHRMRHDVFLQFTNQRKVDIYYTKQSPDVAIELA